MRLRRPPHVGESASCSCALAAVRVILAEDSGLLREGLVRLLGDADIEVMQAVGDADTLLAAVYTQPPDVVVTDIRMPPTFTDEGLTAALTIRARHPKVAVLVLSQYLEAAYTERLLRNSATGAGYLLKDRVNDVTALCDAIIRVARGESVIDPEVIRTLVARPRLDNPLDRLTDRERMLFGRRTWRDFITAWGRLTDGNPFTTHMNAATKYVVSRTLQDARAWQNSILLRGDAVDTVADLKAQPGRDLSIIGSASLVRSLHAAGLIDRYTLLIHPLTLGTGIRLFEDPAPLTEFDLTESVTTTKGVIIAHYTRQ
jgi:DNA-binding NarL/FixJ family response regulator